LAGTHSALRYLCHGTPTPWRCSGARIHHHHRRSDFGDVLRRTRAMLRRRPPRSTVSDDGRRGKRGARSAPRTCRHDGRSVRRRLMAGPFCRWCGNSSLFGSTELLSLRCSHFHGFVLGQDAIARPDLSRFRHDAGDDRFGPADGNAALDTGQLYLGTVLPLGPSRGHSCATRDCATFGRTHLHSHREQHVTRAPDLLQESKTDCDNRFLVLRCSALARSWG